MNIISLNTWSAKIREPFLHFLESHKNNIDIFCFQEIFNKHTGKTSDYINIDDGDSDTLTTIKNILTDHTAYYCPIDKTGTYGIAMFVKNDIEVVEHDSIFIHTNQNYNPLNISNDHNRKLQWLRIRDVDGKEYIIANLHGHWSHLGKGDTPERLEQSKIIADFIDTYKNKSIVLCGDFNLNPNTESIKMMDAKLRNLIAENNVTSTRTSAYTGSSLFADYIFVSNTVDVKSFKVLHDVVSDHAVLFLEI